jgi:hypothetical protein
LVERGSDSRQNQQVKAALGERLDTTRTSGEDAERSNRNSANDNEFTPIFSPVRWLELNKGASRVKRSKERLKSDELWQGDAFDPLRPEDPAVPVYLRLGSGTSLVAELVCGCIARRLGLPAPEVFVVTVKPGTLQRSGLTKKRESSLCVATRDLGGATFTQLLNDDDDAAVQLLHQWTELNKVAAFDEWTANPDRNMGNLIYAAQALYIIDHADAFGGNSRTLYELAEMTEQMFSNKLADLLNVFDLDKRSKMLEEIENWITATAVQLDLTSAVDHAGTRPWSNVDQDKELIDFLQQRLTVTHSLLCNRLGHPQLSLNGVSP